MLYKNGQYSLLKKMITLNLFLCLFVASTLGSRHKDDDEFQKIVGGTPAKLGEYKWIVSLQTRGSKGGHFCGGSILSPNYVLTAAHCVYGNSAGNIQVQYGIIDIQSTSNIVFVSSFTIHPKYNPAGNVPNDIAILKLATAMKLDNKNSGAVALPSAPLVVSNYTTVQLCGWGYRNSSEAKVQRYLLWTDMPEWSDANCKLYVGKEYNPTYHVCAGTLDGQHKQCSGDSGGPLTQSGVQYGIVSWSYKPCTLTNKPGVFTNVGNYRLWIAAQTFLL